eukprot:1503041-Prymnesium_polylepis.1
MRSWNALNCASMRVRGCKRLFCGVGAASHVATDTATAGCGCCSGDAHVARKHDTCCVFFFVRGVGRFLLPRTGEKVANRTPQHTHTQAEM